MNLNITILTKELSRFFDVSTPAQKGKTLAISRVKIWDGESVENAIYLIADDSLTLPPGPFIYLEEMISPKPYRKDTICIHGKEKILDVLDRVMDIFWEYEKWWRALECLQSKKNGINDFYVKAAEKTHGRLLVTDKRMLIFADSLFPKVGESVPGDEIPPDIIKSMRSLPETNNLKVPFVLDGENRLGTWTVYVVPLFFEGVMEGQAVLMVEQGRLEKDDCLLFDILIPMISQQFSAYIGERSHKGQELTRILRATMTGSMMEGEIAEADRKFPFVFSSFQVAYLSWENLSNTEDYLRFIFHNRLEESVLLMEGKTATAIIPKKDAVVFSVLEEISEELSLKIGLSSIGSGCVQLGPLLLQAESANHYGKNKVSMFHECLLPYMRGKLLENMPCSLLLTPGCEKLKLLSEKSSVDYLETLRIYLECESNVTEASHILHLHRSSFLKRLEKIRNAAGAELNTAEGRLLLRMDLMIMGY